MARPKVLTNKFQMMMSEAELKAVDDWMFSQRIKSRAEAIRRLTSFALFLGDRRFAEYGESIHKMSTIVIGLLDAIEKKHEANPEAILSELRPQARSLAAELLQLMHAVHSDNEIVRAVLDGSVDEIGMLITELMEASGLHPRDDPDEAAAGG